MTRSSMPAGSWKGQDKEIQTVGANQCILIRSDTPDDVAYILTKAICENKPRLVETVAIAETSFFPETAWEPNALGAPIHPGAERYYREMGYMK